MIVALATRYRKREFVVKRKLPILRKNVNNIGEVQSEIEVSQYDRVTLVLRTRAAGKSFNSCGKSSILVIADLESHTAIWN